MHALSHGHQNPKMMATSTQGLRKHFSTMIKLDESFPVDIDAIKTVVDHGRDMTYDGVVLVKEFLKNVAVIKSHFSELSSQQVDDICRYFDIETFDEGDTVCYKGDYGDKLYIVLDGALDVSIFEPLQGKDIAYGNTNRTYGKRDHDSHSLHTDNLQEEPSSQFESSSTDLEEGVSAEKSVDSIFDDREKHKTVIARLESSHHFGEEGLYGDVRYSYTIEAVQESRLLVLKRATYQRILQSEKGQSALHRVHSLNAAGASMSTLFKTEPKDRDEDELRIVSDLLSNRIEFFNQFPIDLRIELCRHCDVAVVPANTKMYNEGDVGHAFYMILSGYCRVFTEALDEKGKPIKHLVKTLSTGDSFGDFAVDVKDSKTAVREASVSTYDKATDLLVLRRAQYQKFMHIWRNRDISYRITQLKRIQVFNGMKESQLEEFASIMEPRLYRPDYQIYETGQVAQGMFIIDKGDCRVLSKPLRDRFVNPTQSDILKLTSSSDFPSPLAVNASNFASATQTLKSPKALSKAANHKLSNALAKYAAVEKLNETTKGKFGDESGRGEVDMGRVGPLGLLAPYALLSSDQQTQVEYCETIVSISIVQVFVVTTTTFFTRLNPFVREVVRSILAQLETPVTSIMENVPKSLSMDEITTRRVWQEFRKKVVDSIVTQDKRDPRIMKIFKRIAPSQQNLIEEPAKTLIPSRDDAVESSIHKSPLLTALELKEKARNARRRHQAASNELHTFSASLPNFSFQSPEKHGQAKTHAAMHVALTKQPQIVSRDKRPNSSAGLATSPKKTPGTRSNFLSQSGSPLASKGGGTFIPADVGNIQDEFQSSALPFSLVHFHIDRNSLKWHSVKYFFRVCGAFSSCGLSKEAAETVITNTSIALRLPLDDAEATGCGVADRKIELKWVQYRSKGAIRVENSDHFIVYCRQTAIEVASFESPPAVFSQAYPVGCKLSRQVYCCVALTKSATSSPESKAREPFVALDSPIGSGRIKRFSIFSATVQIEGQSLNEIPASVLATDIFRINEIVICAPNLQECVRLGILRARSSSHCDDPFDVLAIPMYTWIEVRGEALAAFSLFTSSSSSVHDLHYTHSSVRQDASMTDCSDFFKRFLNASVPVITPEMENAIQLIRNENVVKHENSVVARKVLSNDVQKRAVTAPANKGAILPAHPSDFERELKKTTSLFAGLNPEERLSTLMRSTDGWEKIKKQQDDLQDYENVLRHLPVTRSTSRIENNPKHYKRSSIPAGAVGALAEAATATATADITNHASATRGPQSDVEKRILGHVTGPMIRLHGHGSDSKPGLERDESRRLEKALQSTTLSKRLKLLDTLQSLSTTGASAAANYTTTQPANARKGTVASATTDKGNSKPTSTPGAGVGKCTGTEAGASLALKLSVLADMLSEDA